jgi:hypothetical protein
MQCNGQGTQGGREQPISDAAYDVYLYLLLHFQDQDEEVALEAAEFWLAFCESELGMELLQPVMSRLIPVLMHNMVRKASACFRYLNI